MPGNIAELGPVSSHMRTIEPSAANGRSLLALFITIALVLVASIASLWLINRPELIVIDAEPPREFPDEGFSHAAFERLLAEYVDAEGRVDYARWHGHEGDRRTLDGYLAAVAAYSPENAPERFPKRSDELAYWLNAYNAYVIWSVLDHWPLESVTDVKAPLEITTGFGFFWRQRFLFGSTSMSLYAVENDVIRDAFRDPRIHFVLNCASESCPVARPELPTGADLEPYLERATIDFVTNPKNVLIDHANRRVVLSDIFKWYEKDFANELRRRGRPSDRPLVDYLIGVAPPPLAGDLTRADGYAVEFAGYDWGLNEATMP